MHPTSMLHCLTLDRWCGPSVRARSIYIMYKSELEEMSHCSYFASFVDVFAIQMRFMTLTALGIYSIANFLSSLHYPQWLVVPNDLHHY